jgi:urea transport system ATP-binding protein
VRSADADGNGVLDHLQKSLPKAEHLEKARFECFSRLSGGQQQQLAITRALVTQPTLLLLDEPTEGIQPSIMLDIEESIHRLKQEGRMAILLVEQYLNFTRRLADHIYVMEQGTIVLEGKMQELPEEAVKRYLAI